MEFIARGKKAVIYRDLKTGTFYRIYAEPDITCDTPENYIHGLVSGLPFFLKLISSELVLVHGFHSLEETLGREYEYLGERIRGYPTFSSTYYALEDKEPLYQVPVYPALEDVAPFTYVAVDKGRAEIKTLLPQKRYVDAVEGAVGDLRAHYLNLRQKLSLVAMVCVGLIKAQEQYEFVHNDLHPGNVLLKPTSQKVYSYGGFQIPIFGYAPRIADFGWACVYKPTPRISCELRGWKREDLQETFGLAPDKPFDPSYDISYLLLMTFVQDPEPGPGEVLEKQIRDLLRKHGVTWHEESFRPLGGRLLPQTALAALVEILTRYTQ